VALQSTAVQLAAASEAFVQGTSPDGMVRASAMRSPQCLSRCCCVGTLNRRVSAIYSMRWTNKGDVCRRTAARQCAAPSLQEYAALWHISCNIHGSQPSLCDCKSLQRCWVVDGKQPSGKIKVLYDSAVQKLLDEVGLSLLDAANKSEWHNITRPEALAAQARAASGVSAQLEVAAKRPSQAAVTKGAASSTSRAAASGASVTASATCKPESRRNLKPTKPAIEISDADRKRKILIKYKCTMARGRSLRLRIVTVIAPAPRQLELEMPHGPSLTPILTSRGTRKINGRTPGLPLLVEADSYLTRCSWHADTRPGARAKIKGSGRVLGYARHCPRLAAGHSLISS
jgi:hypothetical protein